MHVLVAGAGWLGSAIARALEARGDRVTTVRRGPGATLALDLADPASLDRLPADVSAIVACQAGGAGDVAAYRRAYVEATRTLLEHAARCRLGGFVYTGSTGVFGQTDGSDVEETTPVAPASRNAEILVDAERLVLDAASSALPTRLVRLSGLYGPGRTGILDRVRSGALALGPGDDAWMNFCHLDDAVATVLAALEPGRPAGAIYHATDAFPTRRRDVVRWIADQLGIEPPRRETESGRGASRRVRGVATRRELGLALAYPSFREGLIPHLAEAF